MKTAIFITLLFLACTCAAETLQEKEVRMMQTYRNNTEKFADIFISLTEFFNYVEIENAQRVLDTVQDFIDTHKNQTGGALDIIELITYELLYFSTDIREELAIGTLDHLGKLQQQKMVLIEKLKSDPRASYTVSKNACFKNKIHQAFLPRVINHIKQDEDCTTVSDLIAESEIVNEMNPKVINNKWEGFLKLLSCCLSLVLVLTLLALGCLKIQNRSKSQNVDQQQPNNALLEGQQNEENKDAENGIHAQN
ncbi:unnamed protein product [Moneuplotes crassus]|uniref:Uncharacterized protein n=1 Tax=Euplotes crassus TaxID=5936 RepID=A0AAD1UGG1_EUPCR|nr:unnamed protein product [Moneuplotes crassus]